MKQETFLWVEEASLAKINSKTSKGYIPIFLLNPLGTLEECDAVKSGTEYDDTDQEIANSPSRQKVVGKRK